MLQIYSWGLNITLIRRIRRSNPANHYDLTMVEHVGAGIIAWCQVVVSYTKYSPNLVFVGELIYLDLRLVI